MYRSLYSEKIERYDKRISILDKGIIIATLLTLFNILPNTNLDAVVCVGITCIFLLLKNQYNRAKYLLLEKENNLFKSEMILKQNSSDAKANRALVQSQIALFIVISIELFWAYHSFITNRSNENIGLVRVR